MIRTVILAVCLLTLLVLASCKEKQVTGENVHETMDLYEARLAWVDHRIAGETWELFSSGAADSLQFYRDLLEYVVSDRSSWSVLGRASSQLEDDEDKRRLELMHNRLLVGSVEANSSIRELRDSLAQAMVNYEADFAGEKVRIDRLTATMRTDNSRTRRELAYRARNAVGSELSDGLARLIRMRNQDVRKIGYNNYFAVAFRRQSLDIHDYLRLLSRVDSITAPVYNQIIDRLRGQVPSPPLEIWDIAHAYSSVMQEVDQHFTLDSQLIQIDLGLTELGFDLEKMPIYSILEQSPDRPPMAQTLVVDNPVDQRVVANLGAGIGGQRMMLAAFGNALHSAHVSERTPLFRTVNGPWREGLGRFFGSLCSDREWLTRYCNLPASLNERYMTARNELSIIELRMLLVQLKFEYEAYKGNQRDLNKLYWDIFEQTAMLPRHDDVEPWAATAAFVTQPCQTPALLLGEIIARQTAEYLRQTNGTVVGTDETRAFLVQNYFRFGSRYDWIELLKRGTGQDLNPEVLVPESEG